VADVWQEVLGPEIAGLERVGVEDNFFDLGGYSLLLTRVRFNLRQKLQKEIALVDFFSCPTVRLLAEKLEHDAAAGNQEHVSQPRASVPQSGEDGRDRNDEKQVH
jgi:acyl carrier protein